MENEGLGFCEKLFDNVGSDSLIDSFISDRELNYVENIFSKNAYEEFYLIPYNEYHRSCNSRILEGHKIYEPIFQEFLNSPLRKSDLKILSSINSFESREFKSYLYYKENDYHFDDEKESLKTIYEKFLKLENEYKSSWRIVTVDEIKKDRLKDVTNKVKIINGINLYEQLALNFDIDIDKAKEFIFISNEAVFILNKTRNYLEDNSFCNVTYADKYFHNLPSCFYGRNIKISYNSSDNMVYFSPSQRGTVRYGFRLSDEKFGKLVKLIDSLMSKKKSVKKKNVTPYSKSMMTTDTKTLLSIKLLKSYGIRTDFKEYSLNFPHTNDPKKEREASLKATLECLNSLCLEVLNSDYAKQIDDERYRFACNYKDVALTKEQKKYEGIVKFFEMFGFKEE